jgi:hypothetical protein
MFKSFMILLPLVAAVSAARMRHRSAVRLVAVVAIALSFVLGIAGLIALHHLAEER